MRHLSRLPVPNIKTRLLAETVAVEPATPESTDAADAAAVASRNSAAFRAALL